MATKKFPKHAMRFDMLNTEIAVEADADGDDANLSGVAYNGGVMNHPWFGRIAIDLESSHIRSPLTILYGHRDTAELGQATDVSKDTKVTIKAAKIFNASPEADKVIRLAKKGFKWGFSLGTMPGWLDEIPGGRSVEVNGQMLQGPLLVARGSEIYESTITSIPVDGDTNANVFAHGDEGEIELEIRKGDVSMKTAEELQREIDAMKERDAARDVELASLKASNESLKSTAESIKASVRASKVKDLFASLGREYSEDAGKKYMAMDDETFESISADMKAVKPAPNPALFSASPTPGNGDSASGIDQKSEVKKLAMALKSAITIQSVIDANRVAQ